MRTLLVLNGKPCFKRLFILNKDLTDGNAYFVLSTSKVDWYKNHAVDPDVQGNFLYYECGSTPCNGGEDMVIDLREVQVLPITQLMKNLKTRKLDFLPSMPEKEMDRIAKALSSSKLVPAYIKSKII